MLSLGLTIQLTIEELNAVVIVTLLQLFVALIEKLRTLMIRVTRNLTKNFSNSRQDITGGIEILKKQHSLIDLSDFITHISKVRS